MNDLGADLARLKLGENRLPCPACERGKTDTALSVRLDADGRTVWHCHRCGLTGASGNYEAPMRPQRRHQAAPQRAERPRGLSAYGRELWAATEPISGAARDNLEARACQIPPTDGDLRCLAELKHPSGHIGPALVALITDAETGTPLSLHRTWVRPDGGKAQVNSPRLLLKDHPIGGGVIRLWPDDAVTTGLGIAEGIETALSLAHGFTPVWSCIDAGHMANFPILKGIGELVIAVDNDEAGRKAATLCARRWITQATVRAVTADAEGCDLNDEVRSWVK